ncbi:MAG: acylphosphatase [Deltaproteobacteria bacterium]|nr:acylphosphatase [Deltaproteobacteria bacterium]
MAQIRVQLEISGRVQGVCYRYFTQQSAQAAGINGWVKNRINGNVSALLEGDEHAVASVIELCRQGPQLAHVDHIEIVQQTHTGEFIDFNILR